MNLKWTKDTNTNISTLTHDSKNIVLGMITEIGVHADGAFSHKIYMMYSFNGGRRVYLGKVDDDYEIAKETVERAGIGIIVG